MSASAPNAVNTVAPMTHGRILASTKSPRRPTVTYDAPGISCWRRFRNGSASCFGLERLRVNVLGNAHDISARHRVDQADAHALADRILPRPEHTRRGLPNDR